MVGGVIETRRLWMGRLQRRPRVDEPRVVEPEVIFYNANNLGGKSRIGILRIREVHNILYSLHA